MAIQDYKITSKFHEIDSMHPVNGHTGTDYALPQNTPLEAISDGIITEKYKCFLKGSWKRKTLIVQPSFCLVTEGTDILREEVISEFLEDANLNNFEVFVVAAPDEIKYFGKIRNLEKPEKRLF